MKKSLLAVLFALGLTSAAFAADLPKALFTELKNPESVCYGPEGLLYITEIGEAGKNGDGKVTVIQKDGQKRTFADGLDDPKGIVFFRDALYLTDKTKLIKVDAQGKTSVYMGPELFPAPPLFLNDIAIDVMAGIFLVSDSGLQGKGGAIYRVDVRLHKIELVANAETIPGLTKPNGVAFDGSSHIVFADMAQGVLYRVRVPDRAVQKIAENLEGADGLVWDNFGRLFITSWTTGKVFAIPRPGHKPVLIGEGLKSAADCCLDRDGQNLLIPDMKSGTLTTLPTSIPGWEVNETPMALEWEPAFPNLVWTGWDDGSESGKVNQFRPILMTHASDQSNRIFVPEQKGIIHAFENGPQTKKTTIFLDISNRVRYNDKENEEGLLGLAFHPQFKQNGEFFVFYTDRNSDNNTKRANIVSRFRVKKGDPLTADPASEEEIIRFEKTDWNHNGGTIAFGPEGYLYIVLGDGGGGGDPHGNGQNLNTLFGKVLRIDVNKKSPGKSYGIPADNPFAKQAGAAPEIWALGLRNVWRMAFDSKTGDLWAADVGQGLFEEINLIKAGGNYGWSVREGLHPFGDKGVSERPELSDPIWEYHHNLGVSITGGVVYRGSAIPELKGAYLYGDYVSNRMWALRYDPKKSRVVANQPFKGASVGLMSLGEDNLGEVYAMGATPTSRGIFRLKAAGK